MALTFVRRQAAAQTVRAAPAAQAGTTGRADRPGTIIFDRVAAPSASSRSKATRRTSAVTAYHGSLRSWPAAQLFAAIVSWMGQTKLIVDGFVWTIEPSDEWPETVGLTAEQYKKAIARLCDRGLIKTKHHLVSNRIMTLIRLTDHGRALANGREHS